MEEWTASGFLAILAVGIFRACRILYREFFDPEHGIARNWLQGDLEHKQQIRLILSDGVESLQSISARLDESSSSSHHSPLMD